MYRISIHLCLKPGGVIADLPTDGLAVTVLYGNALLKGIYSADFPSVSGAYLTENFTGVDDAYVSFYLRVNSLPADNVRIVYFSNATITVGNLQLLTRVGCGCGTTRRTLAPTAHRWRWGRSTAWGCTSGVGRAEIAFWRRTWRWGMSRSDCRLRPPQQEPVTPADRLRLRPTGSTAVDVTFDDIRLDAGAMSGP